MKRVAIIVMSLWCANTAYADSVFTMSGGAVSIRSVQASHMIVINGPDGKTATIDFHGGKVSYFGDLPVDDSAKIFFDAVLKTLPACPEAKEVETPK